MSMILCVTTTTEDGKGRGLSFDSTFSPNQIAEMDEDARKSLARLLIGTARNALGETGRHTLPSQVIEMAEYTVMSSDLEFDSIPDLEDFMCAVAFGIGAERERCKAIYDEQTDHMLQEYMKALEDADHWHAHVGTLLGIIEQTYDLGDDIDEEDRPAFDQINGEYEARCLDTKETAAECRRILERAKANVDAARQEV